MTLGGIKAGDIIEADVRGVRFLAMAGERGRGGLAIEPLCKGFTYRHVSAQQVINHWRKAGRKRS